MRVADEKEGEEIERGSRDEVSGERVTREGTR